MDDDLALDEIKLQRLSSSNQQTHNFYANDDPCFPGRKNRGGSPPAEQVLGLVPESLPTNQASMLRHSKHNQELNDELQFKANELEKLFAAHKLRLPGNQFISSLRSKPEDGLQWEDQFEKNTESFGCSSAAAAADFHHSSLRRMADDNQANDNTLKLNIEELGLLQDYRGKFYETYMQKRDAKLKEEWSLKRAQKEAEMKAMQESLEHSRAEMKAKFSGSSDKRDLALQARQHAERLRSFNFHSASKNELQQIVSVQNEEDDLSNLPDHTLYEQDRSSRQAFTNVSTSKSSQTKKHLPNRSLLSSVPRTSGPPITRPSVKASKSASGKRCTQPENLIAQSVPNLKPSSGVVKTSSHQLFRNYSHNKSTNENLSPLVKEDKKRMSQSLRNSSATSDDLKDLPPLNSDSVVLIPLSFFKEQTAEGLYNKVPKNNESKSFLRKGNGIGPGAGAGIAKLKTSIVPENLRNKDEFDDSADRLEDSMNMVKEEEEGEPETVIDEVASKVLTLHADSDNEKSSMSRESDKSSNLGSENTGALRSFSQVHPDLTAGVALPSTFHYVVERVQDSPGESPASPNSRMHHPLSYTSEISDSHAHVDTPTGSPASWNSHSVTKMETDAVRMRKKWGSSQKQIIPAIKASHHQPRKDVKKGFKRLLQFGRKRQGTESPVDWISATTSEGDDDIEDGRMGFSEGYPSYDSFKDGELFKEQVQALCSSITSHPENFKLREDHLLLSTAKAPRSFFSLPSFRSKGSESKPR